MRHIWGDMTYYRPPFDIFFGGGEDVSPVPREIYAPAYNLSLQILVVITLKRLLFLTWANETVAHYR